MGCTWPMEDLGSLRHSIIWIQECPELIQCSVVNIIQSMLSLSILGMVWRIRLFQALVFWTVEHWINLIVHHVWTQVSQECEGDAPYPSNVIDACIYFKTLFNTTNIIQTCYTNISCSVPPPWSLMLDCWLYMPGHTCLNYADVPCHHTSIIMFHVNATDLLYDMGAMTCLDNDSSIWMDLGCRIIRFYSWITPSHSLNTFPLISPCILISDHPVPANVGWSIKGSGFSAVGRRRLSINYGRSSPSAGGINT